MTTDEQYADILALCLDAVLGEHLSIEACIQQYPQYADALRRELRLALLTTKLKPPKLADARVSA
ncbi:MAG: hypothetical protein MUE54_15740, partial [Anaerolineae bacterium]|nr:hypothetical protein [Anaerolineae bacterium]